MGHNGVHNIEVPFNSTFLETELMTRLVGQVDIDMKKVLALLYLAVLMPSKVARNCLATLWSTNLARLEVRLRLVSDLRTCCRRGGEGPRGRRGEGEGEGRRRRGLGGGGKGLKKGIWVLLCDNPVVNLAV